MITRRNQLGFMREALYGLKQNYGILVDVYRKDSTTINLETGKKTVTQSRFRVRRAVLIPSTLMRKMDFSGMDSDFNFGAFFDIANKVILIEGNDIPKNYRFDTNSPDTNWIVIDHKRYDIKETYDLDLNYGVMLALRRVPGSTAYEIYEERLKDLLSINSTIRIVVQKSINNSLIFNQTLIGIKVSP